MPTNNTAQKIQDAKTESQREFAVDTLGTPWYTREEAEFVSSAYERNATSRTQPHIPEDAVASLGKIIAAAERELAYMDHRAPGAEVPHARTAKPAVATGYLNLRELTLTPAADVSGHRTRTLGLGNTAAKSERLDAAIIQRSRVALAGAQLIVAAERPAPSDSKGGAFYRDAGLFRLIEAATFASVADGADAADSAWPFHSALIEWPDAPSIAFRTTATRRQQKDVGGASLAQDLLQSMLFGLAQAADKTLLAAIVAATPAAFTLGAAAARNLEFRELRALVGTAGTGAAVGQDGTLRVSGVLAELTPATAATIVGSFNRSAVAIHPELVVHVERRNLQGDLVLTCFANLQAVLPDSGAFWKVA